MTPWSLPTIALLAGFVLAIAGLLWWLRPPPPATRWLEPLEEPVRVRPLRPVYDWAEHEDEVAS